IILLLSLKIIKKPSDKDHDYGHGKFETLVTTIIGLTLFFVGIGILYTGGKNIYSVIILKNPLPTPGIIALIAAVVSITTKELLYRYTITIGAKIKSQAVIANAWDHRADAFSSIGVLFGIGGAILLGQKGTILDPLAAIIVSFFILKAAYVILIGSINELLEESLDEKTEDEIVGIVKTTSGAKDPHNLKTRKIGNKIVIDIHIRVCRTLSIIEAHNINTEIENKIKGRYGEGTIINIHTEPEKL
ncbi:cation transporter, partial [candidate division WOR-1 bacterium RIFOXYD2_FULL_36_8]